MNDEVLGYVGRIRGLTALEINDFRFGNLIQVTPAGVTAFLEGVDGLEEFVLLGDVVDDRCMERIAQMKDMRRLWVTSRTISPQAWGKLAGLRRMQNLNLRGMTELHNLYVAGTPVTVKGLEIVSQKQKMSMMRVGNRPLSADEFTELRAMFERSEIFDPVGFWSPQRQQASGLEPGAR